MTNIMHLFFMFIGVVALIALPVITPLVAGLWFGFTMFYDGGKVYE